jgi:hypothetical protein
MTRVTAQMRHSPSPGEAVEARSSDPHHEVFAWDPTGLVAADVRCLVDARLACLPERCAATVARLLRISGDGRLLAEYLRAVAAADRSVAELCERIADESDEMRRGRLRYALGRLRFGKSATERVVLRDNLLDVLDANDDHIAGYVADQALRDVFGMLLDDLGSGLSRFIEHQHEVPGPNARIRQGVVKTWFLPDGSQVASKRENPLKPGRFRREQCSYQEILRRLGVGPGESVPMGRAADGRNRELCVVPVVAVLRDGASSRIYSISRWVPSTSLESILLPCPPGPERAGHLRDYRDLMEVLLDHGILWGDLSPRNVLHCRYADRDIFHMVDFEKTFLHDLPVSNSDRVLYCRGQVAVEELGVLCSPSEVRECLEGYFDPADWDLASEGPVPFPQRPEVAAVLRGRGITGPALGVYNRTDLEIFDVRSPDLEPLTGRRRYPGQVNFRVEHYLSCAGHYDADNYDRITTEVLIAARQHGCFDAALQIVTRAVDEVERKFVVAEFADALDGRRTDGGISPPDEEIRTLIGQLDALDTARADPGLFRTTCADLAKHFEGVLA